MPYKKVRTGCRTCKARKLKCDETKPACLRCTRARFSCEGYSIFVPDREQLFADNGNILCKTLRAADSVIFYRKLSCLVDLDEINHNAYDFCRRYTVHELSARNKFWTSTVLAGAEQEPAVLYALLALTAAHKARTEQLEGVIASTHHNKRTLVDGHYYKAVQLLYNRSFKHQAQQTEYVLIVCLILLGCDLLQGRYGEALLHLKNGRRILQSAGPEEPTSLPLNARPATTFDQLALEFASLDIQAGNFGSPKLHFNLVDGSCSPCGIRLAEVFDGLEDAERFLLIIHNQFCNFAFRHANPIKTSWNVVKDSLAVSEQARLLSELEKWKRAFDASALRPLKASLLPSSRSSTQSRYAACRLMHSYLTIVTETALHVGNEMVFDALLPHFSTMITMCEELVPISPQVTLDIGIIQPLFILGCYCRHPNIRRRCLQVLAKSGVEGHWDARLIRLLTLRRMQVEEEESGYSYNPDQPVPEDPELLSTTIPSYARYTFSFALFLDVDYRRVEIQLIRKGLGNETSIQDKLDFEINKMVVDWPPSD